MKPDVAEVVRWLEAIYVAAEGAHLRQEDRRKAIQVAALLGEIDQAARHVSRRDPLVLVDAAAGKAYVGALAAKLLFEPAGRAASVITIERDEARVAASRLAVERVATTVPITCLAGEVASAALWPPHPSIVVALHACGPAADAIIARAIGARARHLLMVPCCTSEAVPAMPRVRDLAERLDVPRQAPVRRRFLQAMVDADRTWRLEAAGYETEVVEFVGATVTPHNLLWRCRRVEEPHRMAAARARLAASGEPGTARRDEGGE